MGVSPIACGAPGDESKSGHFCLDMAPSVAARGKIYKALRRGESIPSDWALDKEVSSVRAIEWRHERLLSDVSASGLQGNRTEDPEKALEGVMLPMGGPKGSALAIMMDVFSGVLSGSAFAVSVSAKGPVQALADLKRRLAICQGHVVGPYDPTQPADVGHFLVAIKPDLFMDMSEFKSRLQYLYDRVVGSEKMAGVDRVYFPGELEQICAKVST